LVGHDLRAVDIALDVSAGKMYWMADEIERANLDGSQVETVLPYGGGLGSSLALDVVAGKLYWTDSLENAIKRANFDGTGVETVVADTASAPLGLALLIQAPEPAPTQTAPPPSATSTPAPRALPSAGRGASGGDGGLPFGVVPAAAAGAILALGGWLVARRRPHD
jgi:hypothetical protein